MALDQITSQSIASGAITVEDIADGSITHSKLHTTAITDKLGYTPANEENSTFTGGSITIPAGTTSERPASPSVGMIRYNTTLGFIEQYTIDGWKGITSPPQITSLNVAQVNESNSTQTIVITGSNFDSGSSAILIAKTGAELVPTTSVRNSSTQITITYSGGDIISNSALEPLSVRVTNSVGLSTRLSDALAINNTPIWSTSVGSVGTVYENNAISTITLSATDPESSSITYSIVSGSLPTGLTLNTSNGQITGTPAVNDSYNSSGVVHNFSVQASDGTNTVNRSFSILRKWIDGSSIAAAISPSNISSLTTWGIPSGMFYINLPNAGPYQYFIDTEYNGGGWILALSGDRYVGDGTSTPPRDGVAAYGNGDAFFTGTRGSNQNWTFAGYTLNTYATERLFQNLAYTQLRVAGNSFTNVDGSGYNFDSDGGYYNKNASQAYKAWNVIMQSSASSTHASKLNNTTSWSVVARAKQNLVYNQSWSTSYSAGNFKLGWYQTNGPSYGDYGQCWISGGQAQRQGLSASLYREQYPGLSTPLHDSPTTVTVAMGYAGHRGGGSYYNDSLWFKV